MLCTAASRLLGYVKIALVAMVWGATGQADALWATFAIPNDLRKLFAEGAFSSAFIPVLSTTLVEDPSGERARMLARRLFTFQLLILAPLVGLSVAFPRPFIDVLTAFRGESTVALSAELFRWMFSYILLVSVSATVMAVLNSHQSFVVPALSPLVFSLAVIAGILLLGRALGPYAMALGVVVGGLAQLAFQVPAYLRRGYGLRPALGFRDPDLRRALGLWLPFLASASIFTLNQIVARLFASGLDDGSVSAINYSVTVLQLPVGLFTASVMTVLFPAMSRQAAVSDREGLRGTVAQGLQLLTVLLVPSTVYLVGFGREVIAVALQRGAFTAEATDMASRALTAYAAGLVCLGLYTFLQRYFYSLKDFRTPILSALCICGVDIALSLILKETPLRVAGLAVANSVAFAAGMVWLAVAARRRLGRLEGRAWLGVTARTLVACVPMTGLVVWYRTSFPDLWRGGSRWATVGIAVGFTAVLVAVTLGMMLALRVPHVKELLTRARRAP